MQAPLVSIVIPIYNVEHYLRQCLESVTNQTYRNLEIILVDDGSLDNCPQICDATAAKDSRIIVIHKKNGGLSDARNAGLKKISGEFIFFIDSDDFITKDCIEQLVHESQKNYYDVVIAQHASSPIAPKIGKESIVKDFNTNLQIIEAFSKNIFFPCAWNKLYKASFIKNNLITFKKGILFEDQLWSLHWIMQASSICIIQNTTYIYNARTASIMGSCKKNLSQSLRSWEVILTEYNKLFLTSNLPNQLKYNLLIQKIEESLNLVQKNFAQFKDFYERIQSVLPIQTIYGNYKTNSIIKDFLYKTLNYLPSSLFKFSLYLHIKSK